MKLQINSEVGKLRSILLHKPGRELDNLIPDNMHDLLFDDLPDREMAAQEYDDYLKILKDAGVDIYFIEDLIVEALAEAGNEEEFLRTFFSTHTYLDEKQTDLLLQYFSDMQDNTTRVNRLIAGVRREEIAREIKDFPLSEGNHEFFALNPLPNLYFTRDFMTTIGDTVSLNQMHSPARQPESVLVKWVFDYHPAFKDVVVHDLNSDQNQDTRIEGGDIIILSDETVIIGISQRTGYDGVARMARELFRAGGVKNLRYVLGMEIPSKRAYMHLDTVFTQVDTGCFLVHPCVQGEITMYEYTAKICRENAKPTKRQGRFDELLAHYTGQDKVSLIQCGGDSPVEAEREQWNDGANTLALNPGEIIVYNRNRDTNKLLEEAGITLHELKVSELARGRGGPHCMSQPLYRDFL